MTTFDWLSDLAPLFDTQESWRSGDYHEESIFHLVYRPEGPFSIACGASLLAEHIRRFRFSPDIIRRLGQVTDERGRSLFDESYLNFLQRLRLRVNVSMPAEGTLVLPGEPLLIARGPVAQIRLLESAFRLLIWQSTHWATLAALARWKNHDWEEEDTPAAPIYQFNPEGWRVRALYLGGASASDIANASKLPEHQPSADEGLRLIFQNSKGNVNGAPPLVQIRRLYKGSQTLGDVWLTEEQDRQASVSKTTVRFEDKRSGETKELRFTRFQQLYLSILAKGHPVLPTTRKGYLRQRTLHQMKAFHAAGLDLYPYGWCSL